MDIETPAGLLAMAEGPAPGPMSGCGTGEHAVMAANLGLEAIGMDTAGKPLRLRKRKARERGRAADSWFLMRFA